MSEVPTPANGAGFLRKKVAGIPVIYLAAGFAVILVAIAWNMKSAPKASTGEEEAGQVENSGDTILRESEYPPLPLGTVSTTPTTPGDVGGNSNSSIEDNDTWLKRGVMFLSEQGVSPGDAQQALTLYLDGAELSYEQGQWRDKVIRELGMPPYPVNIGGTRPDVGRAQGPLPRGHIVKNVNDDSAAELAGIYYGGTSAYLVDAIKAANNGAGNYTVGQTVQVPVRPAAPAAAKPTPATTTPKPPPKSPPKPTPPPKRYHIVKKGESLSLIAKRYYGNANLWPKIYNVPYNKSKIGKNPNLIYSGTKLEIPR